MSEVSISVNNLTKFYPLYNRPIDRLKEALHPFRKKYHHDFYALNSVSFDIPKGEAVGIIGQNGSGKSTLLKIITGVTVPSSGEVIVNGRISSLLELGAGFNPELTGVENVYFYGTINGLTEHQIDEKLDDILSFADIGEFIDQPVKTYSSGMFVRLAFSCAIQIDPEILIVDEALAVGDVYFVHKCMLRIKQMKEKNVTILFVTHDSTAIKTICNSAIWLHDGLVKRIGNPNKVSDEYLAYIFDQKEIKDVIISNLSVNNFEKNDKIEMCIPNIDRRIGDQRCMILGIGVYDKQGNPIKSIENNSDLRLRVSFQNQTHENLVFSIGYILRNSRAFEIASSNSIADGFDFHPILPKEIKTGIIDINIPLLHPGNYSISLGIACMLNGELIEADRIDNCANIDIYSHQRIHVLMKFPASYKLEI